MADKIKLGLAALIVIAAIAGYYYLGASAAYLRFGVVVLGVLLALGVVLLSGYGQRFRVYAGESLDEARKVVWPTRKETMQTTGVVIVFVLVMALFLWVVDSSLGWLTGFLIGRAS